MMNWLHLLWGFLVANLLGYGGGPSTIPLMQEEIVHRYQWLTNGQFADVLAVGNALPGPIATKIAAFVGYEVAGWPGLLAALVATVVPTAVGLIAFMRLLARFRGSKAVRGMTMLVQPVIAVMLVLLTWEMGQESVQGIGILQFLGIAAVSLWALVVRKIHPAFVILAAFAYGGLVLSHWV
ncbi:transporter [Kyrpidia spormannii]|uniref:Transporter n=2 Tax=Kyrpidia spormannii TaxID=2055160 RepID=A0A2K8N352_9BACL|nr:MULTISPECIES: chromate transporter [Kyrpidia]ATY83896.1 transporter [Kyrpidia spormannii]MCL6576840.1 chromate transporter [Kyrpidia sp.]CAB3389689.1 chromate transporter subunit C [Kyrpidia spormannii]CAB3390589.1 chromate transporter subunit C [Kyrpidia spormannii]